MILRTAFAIGALVIGSPAVSQSSLGITGATLEVTSTEDEAGQLRNSFATSVDVRITEYHGLQGDLRFDETLRPKNLGNYIINSNQFSLR